MNRDICYGLILFFLIKSILGITGIIGYEIAINFMQNIYIAPVLLMVVAIILLIICFRTKKFPYIRLWVIPLILLINLGTTHLDYSQKIIEVFSEVEKAMLFTLVTGIQEITLIILVVLAYIKYRRSR